ncbi:MAG: DMT family transporter [Selenomonadaceae bacterium]
MGAGVTDRRRGIIYAVSGGMLWGGSGVAGQYLLQDAGLATEWLVTARLVIGGVILLMFDAWQNHGDIFSVWRSKKNAMTLFFFGIMGMMLVSYSYFACIRYSNAATSTVMQYLMPALIVIYTAVRFRRLPTILEMGCVGLAMLGTFLLVTHGDIHSLVITPIAFAWGMVSAASGAIYTMTPRGLIRAWRAPLIVGWGMLIGGVALGILTRPGLVSGEFTEAAVFAFLYLVIGGTVLAFSAYLGSTKYLLPSETGVLASTEPVTAIVLSILILGQPLTLMDILGSVCILLTVVLLARKGDK